MSIMVLVVDVWYVFVGCYWCVFFFKQKTAYEVRISDWSSDVCSSDLRPRGRRRGRRRRPRRGGRAGAGAPLMFQSGPVALALHTLAAAGGGSPSFGDRKSVV